MIIIKIEIIHYYFLLLKILIIKNMNIDLLKRYENSSDDSFDYTDPEITQNNIYSVCQYYPETLCAFDFKKRKLEDVEKILLSFISHYKLRKICVSLSGGVDSMVSVSVLKYLTDSNKIDIAFIDKRTSKKINEFENIKVVSEFPLTRKFYGQKFRKNHQRYS